MRQDTPIAVQTIGLGKRYKSFWALKDCTITIPEGRICGLVGPNGAGKTTLLKLLAGLSSPTTGSSMVFGASPRPVQEFLAEVGYLAQEVPLYTQFDADTHISMGARLNKVWDEVFIRERLQKLDIPFDRPVGELSGGQRAQVALALALAKRPRLLLLDEPVASLDPLARVDFLASLEEAVKDSNMTVVMSSHLLDDLKRICNHLVILAAGKTQICDDITNVLATHRLLIGAKEYVTPPSEKGFTIIREDHSTQQTTLLIRENGALTFPRAWKVRKPSIESIVLAYMGQAMDSSRRNSETGGKA